MGFGIVRSEWIEFLQVAEEFPEWCLWNQSPSIDVDDGTCLFRQDILWYELFEAFDKGRCTFSTFMERPAWTSEVFQKVAAVFNGFVDIESGDERADPVAMSSVRVSTTAGR